MMKTTSIDSVAPPATSPLRGTSFHSCPKHLQAFDIFQELLGHEHITTTEIYLHVAVGTNGLGVQTPLDTFEEKDMNVVPLI